MQAITRGHFPSSHGDQGSTLEEDLQVILAYRRGRSATASQFDSAIQSASVVGEEYACRLLQGWGVRSAAEVAQDAVQEWMIQVTCGSFIRCDERRATGLAYCILRRVCIATLLSEVRHDLLPAGFDVDVNTRGPLDELIDREERELLTEGVSELPPKLRKAACRPLRNRHGRTRSPRRMRVRRRTYQLRFQAKKILAARFAFLRDANGRVVNAAKGQMRK